MRGRWGCRKKARAFFPIRNPDSAIPPLLGSGFRTRVDIESRSRCSLWFRRRRRAASPSRDRRRFGGSQWRPDEPRARRRVLRLAPGGRTPTEARASCPLSHDGRTWEGLSICGLRPEDSADDRRRRAASRGVVRLAARVGAPCSNPVLSPRLSVALRGPPRNRCAFVPSAASCRLSHARSSSLRRKSLTSGRAALAAPRPAACMRRQYALGGARILRAVTGRSDVGRAIHMRASP
jgi:hypothetical protein